MVRPTSPARLAALVGAGYAGPVVLETATRDDYLGSRRSTSRTCVRRWLRRVTDRWGDRHQGPDVRVGQHRPAPRAEPASAARRRARGRRVEGATARTRTDRPDDDQPRPRSR